MKIIVGLGNPGTEYENTRHNIGFMVLDILKEKLKSGDFQEKNKFQSMISEGELNGEKVFLVKPLTFMNLSGNAVQSVMQFYKSSAQDLMIIVDDLDLPFGEFKIKSKGGPGSHNGMISIINQLSTKDFPRIKIGIEARKDEIKAKYKGKDYVLSGFSGEEEKELKPIKDKACEAALEWLKNGINSAMNKFNQKT
ncbi:aminoacyl-tRNA hydrolase [Candidatus Peregrinibacteria bacterium]|nr:aminoacyl-tRNA hydrolase [Candidatus Peregrinibacteria bacterium]